ncbi:MAG: aminotransferase class I/II-fold pyridoxal phosphate-dependent enzyme [Nodosilinea sp.]
MLDQTQTPLLTALQASGQRHQAAFYAPGHKRGRGASARLKALLGEGTLLADLPELPELDNLFAPEGIILAAQELAAAAFGAAQTWFLANGSTCGIEAALLATCGPGDQVMVPRNAHRSVIAGLILAGAMPIYLSPDYDPSLGLALGVSADTIAAALAQHPDTRAVLVVSPTYHGVCSDLKTIANLAHDHGIPLLVDEAHGPHFAFHPALPSPALTQGADLVVQSTHKVLGALTQASMLHVGSDRIDRDRLQAALQLTQSTSPSYLLLASLDAARHQMATAGAELLDATLALAGEIRSKLGAIPGLRVINPADVLPFASVAALDLTRLTVDVSGLGISGLVADEILHNELGVTVELPELRHLTLIVSIGNTLEDGQRCVAGFTTLRAKTAHGKSDLSAGAHDHASSTNRHQPDPSPFTQPQVSPREAFFAATTTVPADLAIGRLSAETLSAYPPGIPTVVAGERITAAAIAHLSLVKEQGGNVTGCSDSSLTTLKVLVHG